jgi:hypothetical protein
MYPHVVDEFDQAMAPQISTFHGQVNSQAFKIAWQKDSFKAHQVYDPAVHTGDSWKTGVMISLVITPLDPARKLITRDIMNFSREFSGVIRPSLEVLSTKIAAIRKLDAKACNPLREVNGLWVAGEFVRRLDNKPDENWTTIKFLDVFATEVECAAHAAAAQNAEPQAAPAAPPTGATADDAQRKTLAVFLPTLWNQAHRNTAEFAALLAANPMLAGLFTLDSPEVKEVCVP